MKGQKELKELYREELKKAWDSPRMVDYCTKQAAFVIELNEGELARIERPDIKKDFCFGHGFCGVSTNEDEDRANNMARVASTSTDYFTEKNMEHLNRATKQLTCGKYKVYIHPHYSGQTPDCKLVCYELVDQWSTAPENSRELTPEEVEKIVFGFEEVKKAFSKRLNTYLKRYGLSKVNTWTYLVD